MKKKSFFLFTFLPRMMIFVDICGQILKKLEDLGIAFNTIAGFAADNIAKADLLPDTGTTHFTGEKAIIRKGHVTGIC